MIWRTVSIVSLAVLVLLAGWSYGLNQEVGELRSALAAEMNNNVIDSLEDAAEQVLHDQAAVEALNVRYARAFDLNERNGAAWADTFTADGVFVVGGEEHVGHGALILFQQGLVEAGRRTRHVISNIEMTRRGDTATASAYLTLYTPADKAGGEVKVSTSRYEDELVLTEAGWKFKRREVVPDTLPANEE